MPSPRRMPSELRSRVLWSRAQVPGSSKRGRGCSRARRSRTRRSGRVMMDGRKGKGPGCLQPATRHQVVYTLLVRAADLAQGGDPWAGLRGEVVLEVQVQVQVPVLVEPRHHLVARRGRGVGKQWWMLLLAGCRRRAPPRWRGPSGVAFSSPQLPGGVSLLLRGAH